MSAKGWPIINYRKNISFARRRGRRVPGRYALVFSAGFAAGMLAYAKADDIYGMFQKAYSASEAFFEGLEQVWEERVLAYTPKGREQQNK